MKDRDGARFIVVGSGAREHAMAESFLQSPRLERLRITPGNPGTSRMIRDGVVVGRNLPRRGGEIKDHIDQIIRFSKRHHYTPVIGHEEYLLEGAVNRCLDAGLEVFGPTAEAAQVETSKAWSGEFCLRHNIPCAETEILTTLVQAEVFIKDCPWGDELVLKADGLARGKGVVLPNSKEEALFFVEQVMEQGIFRRGGESVVAQKRLYGPEVSIIAFVDGENISIKPLVQDNKRLFDGDIGPNTGGMAAYGPVPHVTEEQLAFIKECIMQKAVDGLRKEGREFKGCLYAGIMMTPEGPKVIEFNARPGDPEEQVQAALTQTDYVEIIESCIRGKLRELGVKHREGAAAAIVLASENYAVGQPVTGDTIFGTTGEFGSDLSIFQAGTIRRRNGSLATNGGRVLNICAYEGSLRTTRENLLTALQRCYDVIGEQGIHFRAMQYRKDLIPKAAALFGIL